MDESFFLKKVPEHILVEGILELDSRRNGHLLDLNYLGKVIGNEPFITKERIERFRLRPGQHIKAQAVPVQGKNNKITFIEEVDGLPLDVRSRIPAFFSRESEIPDIHLPIALGPTAPLENRLVDLFSPLAKGQRGIIAAPPKTGKTQLIQKIASVFLENYSEIKVIVVLVDERPEEVTDFRRTLPKAEIWASSNDEELSEHIRIAEMAFNRAKNSVEAGKDVFLVLDSLTRLGRAYNGLQSRSGRTLSGGIDSRALEKPRQLFSLARKFKGVGSLTILASILIDTGNRMDELWYQEFKGMANMEILLDRNLADERLWPAMNLSASGVRNEEHFLSPAVFRQINFLRRSIAGKTPSEGLKIILNRLQKTQNNQQLLEILASVQA